MLNKLTSHCLQEVTTILQQAHLDVVLHVVSSVSHYHAVNLPDLICNVLF